jgi:hypothetical protein
LERFDDTLFPNLLGKYREAGMGVTDIPETFHVLKCSSQTKGNIRCIFGWFDINTCTNAKHLLLTFFIKKM